MGPDVFEIGVAHVFDGEDVDVGVFGAGILDVGVEAESKLFAFFLGFGRVDDFLPLGFGHFGGWSFAGG